MKKCDLGDHEVSALWRSRTKTQCSGCKDCIGKEKAQEQKKQPLEEVNGKLYKKVEIKAKRECISNDNGLEGKSIPELLKLAQIVFNRWIKRRDAGTVGGNCISCGNWYSVQALQAGHYMPSTYSSLRFSDDNVNIECERCNCGDPNHISFYRINLIKKIGLQRVEELEATPIATYHKWEREELLNIIEKYK